MIFCKHATDAEKEIFSNLLWVHNSISIEIAQSVDSAKIDHLLLVEELIKLTDCMLCMAESKPDIYQKEAKSNDQPSELEQGTPLDSLIRAFGALGESIGNFRGGCSDDPPE